MPRSFFGARDPEYLHERFVRCQSVHENCFPAFSPGIWDFLRPKYEYNNHTSGGRQTYTVHYRIEGGSQNACAKIQDISPENGVNF